MGGYWGMGGGWGNSFYPGVQGGAGEFSLFTTEASPSYLDAAICVH